MSAYPELTRLPDTVVVGQMEGGYATLEYEGKTGLAAFLSKEHFDRSNLGDMVGKDPETLSRAQLLTAMVNTGIRVYLIDPDTETFRDFFLEDDAP